MVNILSVSVTPALTLNPVMAGRAGHNHSWVCDVLSVGKLTVGTGLRFVMYLVWGIDSWYRTEVCDVLSGMVDEADQKTFILTSRPDQPRLLSPVSSPSSYPGFFLTVSHQPFLRFFLSVSHQPFSISISVLLPVPLPVPSSQSLHDSAHHYRSVRVIPKIHRAAGENLTR